MAALVYIETSVISYYVARISRDIVTAARQTITQDWWDEARKDFEVYISALVVEESKAGDLEAARLRLAVLAELLVLEINDDAEQLAKRLVRDDLIPKSFAEDALHIALAAVHGMDFLLTWNFRHINNAETKAKIRIAVEAAGYECPVICSPEELGGSEL